ncbi:predicted protein [Uncinocarpus reesii 1704]|uniref:Uncharacterized protein n=1 Tax=Uncinocarpus reesii (strain UAMH 1704) TaxID=336963 RepID=C4JTF5_UNCRE|nr:uncharacterized protein UREG_05744 [Uncinocarpus reesii 1704]EEP80902.1 predicted protein [Uncinocarpus reesii 1704]
MKFLSVIAGALLMTGAMAMAEEAGPTRCEYLSKRDCRLRRRDHDDNRTAGVYCGYCPELTGRHVEERGHRDFAYRIDRNGDCCSLGERRSCRGRPNENRNCPRRSRPHGEEA